MKKNLINWLGLLGVVSLLSYTAAVVFAPLGYPGYDWMKQAVSDLSATDAPSRVLWNQPVSYTHLDVYKRQFNKSTIPRRRGRKSRLW